jgi:protein-S-isoprenylcysteine O-methyltransferase Ste14
MPAPSPATQSAPVQAQLALVGLVYRIYVEETALLEELGGRYRRYAEGHKRLVPFFW